MSPAQIPGNAWSWNLTCKCSSVAKSCPYIFRPPYSCRQTRGFTAILSSSSSILFYLLFSSATLRADWTEPSQNRPNARKWVRFENVPNLGYTLSLQIGVQNHPFLMTSQLNGNFHSLYLRNETKTHIGNRANVLETTMGLLHRLKICRRKVRVILSNKLGTKKLLHLFSFSMTSRLNGECLLH